LIKQPLEMLSRVQTRETVFNEKWAEIIGYTLEELSPISIDTWEKHIHPDDLKKSNEVLEKHFAGETDYYTCEVRMKHKNGSWVWILDRGKVFEWTNDGKPHRMAGTHLDITEQKESEMALNKSEEKLKSLFNAMTDAVFEIDYNGQYLSMAPTSVPFVYRPTTEVINKTLHEIFSKPDADRYLAFIRNCIDNKTANTLDYTIFINNQIKWFEGRVVPKTNKSVLFIARDITETIQARLEAKESQTRFKALSEATNEAILISENGIIIEVNQAASNLLGYLYYEFIGENTIKFIAEQSRGLAKQNILSSYYKPYDVVIKRKDGTEFYAELQGRMFTYKGKKSQVTVIKDITERKKHEILLKESTDKLKDLNTKLTYLVRTEVEKNRKKDHLMIVQSKQAAMGEMISNIAHQWRQPLNDIGLFIQSIQDSYQYGELTLEEINNTVAKTMNKLDYMSQTIDDFRNFFRSDKQKVSFLLADVIRKTLTLTEASFENNDIELIIDLQENVSITNYPNEFSQALLNILNNAKDALVHKKITDSKIKIKLSKKRNKIKLVVADNAGGITKDIIDKIFDPYFTTKSKLTGTGLGLYISKTIIERNMLGRLIARNKNDWAEFIIEFDC